MSDISYFHDVSDEPARDAQLGALLRDVVGDPAQHEVRWDALAERIHASVTASESAPWWSYAERWERRVLPLAMAAGLVGALAIAGAARLRSETTGAYTASDAVSAVVWGASSDDAARSFAHSLTSGADVLAVGVPE